MHNESVCADRNNLKGMLSPMTPASWALLAVLALCVALSAYFSASETAFMAVSRVRLKNRQQQGDRRAARALDLADRGDQLLSTILVGNNLVNIAAAAIATVLFTMWVGDMGATLSTVVMTVLILIVGEVTPKTLARRFPERVALAVARPLYVLMRVFTPVNALFNRLQRLLVKLSGPDEETDIEAELITMVDEAQQEGDIDPHESSLIRSAIEFVDQDVKDVMTPRVDVTALADDTSVEAAADAFRESGYSRLPVYHEDLDHVVGVLNEKDFYAAQHRGEQDIRAIMVPPVFAPATLKISKLLKLCQSTRMHLVVVLDEFGGTEGIVTLEDALEELVGEIYDEHDDVSEEMTAQDGDAWLVDGGMSLTECLERLGVVDRYEAETVGGWASEMLGRIPEQGAVFEEAGLRCTVAALDRRRVTRVRIERIPAPAQGDEGAEPAKEPKKEEAGGAK